MPHIKDYYNNTNYLEGHYRKFPNTISTISFENFMYFFTKGYFYPYDVDSNTFILGYEKKRNFEYNMQDDPNKKNYHLINHNDSFTLDYDNADNVKNSLDNYTFELYKEYKEDNYYKEYTYLEGLNFNNSNPEPEYKPRFKNIFGMICDLHGEYIDNTYSKLFGDIDTIEYMNWLGYNTFGGKNYDFRFFEQEMPSILFTNVYDTFYTENRLELFRAKLLGNIEYIYNKCKIVSNNNKEELLKIINEFDFSKLEYYFIDENRCNYNLNKNQTDNEIVDILYNIIISDFLNNENDEYLIIEYLKSIFGASGSEDERVIVSGNYYYRKVGHTIMGLGLLFSNLIRNEEMIGFLKGGNLISFFEDMIFAFTGENINISKKFYAEINNQNKILFARLMLDKMLFNYMSNENIFNEKITYYLLKKNILPEKYQGLGRSNIERLKGGELLDIIINDEIFYNHFGEESFLSALQEGSYINALSPIDYIYHIKLLEHRDTIKENNSFKRYNISELLKSYFNKSDLIKDYYNHNYDYIVDNFLSNNTYYELTNSIIIESDYLSELMSIGISPQGSCQSILYDTGFNHKLIGHILNPLTKLFIEVTKPDNLKEIDFYNRQFILEDGKIEQMNKYITARVIGAIKNKGFVLQRYYGYSSSEFRNLGETTIKNKYYDIGIELKEYANVFQEQLGINNYYSE